MKRTLDGAEKKQKPELVLILASRLSIDDGASINDRSGSFGLVKCMWLDGDIPVVMKEAKPAQDVQVHKENRSAIKR